MTTVDLITAGDVQTAGDMAILVARLLHDHDGDLPASGNYGRAEVTVADGVVTVELTAAVIDAATGFVAEDVEWHPTSGYVGTTRRYRITVSEVPA